MNLPLDGEISSHISSLFHAHLRSVDSRVSPWDESFYCSHPAFAAERAVRQTARRPASAEDGFSLNREQDGTMGGGWGTLRDCWARILNKAQGLQRTGEVAVTLSGVCLCAFWTALLYQLLWVSEPPPPQWSSSHNRSSACPWLEEHESFTSHICVSEPSGASLRFYINLSLLLPPSWDNIDVVTFISLSRWWEK